jgi:hypothetical protein
MQNGEWLNVSRTARGTCLHYVPLEELFLASVFSCYAMINSQIHQQFHSVHGASTHRRLVQMNGSQQPRAQTGARRQHAPFRERRPWPGRTHVAPVAATLSTPMRPR